MSVSSNEEIYGKWDQFRREIQEELSRERDQRIAEWTSFQHEMEQTRQRERDNRIVDRENLELFSKAANLLDPKRDANSSIHSTSAFARVVITPPDSMSLAKDDTLMSRTIEQQRTLRELLQSNQVEDALEYARSPAERAKLNRAQRPPTDPRLSILKKEDAIIRQDDTKSILFATRTPSR